MKTTTPPTQAEVNTALRIHHLVQLGDRVAAVRQLREFANTQR